MHSSSEAIAEHRVAFHRSGVALGRASRVLAVLDQACARLLDKLRRAAEARRRHREMVETIALLSSLDKHQLRDIGIDEGHFVPPYRKASD